MEQMGLLKKYGGLVTIAVGIWAVGMGGKMLYDYYFPKENIEILSKEEREQKDVAFPVGLFIAGLGLFGMALGYEDHSRYYLNGRDPLHLLSESDYIL